MIKRLITSSINDLKLFDILFAEDNLIIFDKKKDNFKGVKRLYLCTHLLSNHLLHITSNSIFPFLIFLVYCSNDNTRFSLEWGRSNFSTRYVIVFLILLLTTLYRNCACTPRSPRTFFILLPLMFFINKKKKKKKLSFNSFWNINTILSR